MKTISLEYMCTLLLIYHPGKPQIGWNQECCQNLIINATCVHIPLFLYTLARSTHQSKIPSSQKMGHILLVGILFAIQTGKTLKNYPWKQRIPVKDG